MGNMLDLTSGFVVRRKPYSSENEVWYRWNDGATVSWMRSSANYNEDSGVPWMWPVTLKNNSSLGAIVFQGGDFETYVERLFADTAARQCSFTPPPHWIDLGNKIKADIGLGSTPIVVGVSVNAEPMPGQDRLHALVRDGNNYSEAHALLADTGLFFFNDVMGTDYHLDFLGLPRHLAYFRDQDRDHSFAQWMDGDVWRTWIWHGPPGPDAEQELFVVSHRIDAVLSQDAGLAPATYLFSAEDQVGRVYKVVWDSSVYVEELVAEFPLGALRFIGEMYATVGGTTGWWMLFSRSVLTGDQIGFEIRAIATANLVSTFGL
jgi:hypothetical protein